MKCRICHSENLDKFLDLGEQPLADLFLTKEQLLQPEAVYPLEVYFCPDCTLVQLGHVVSPEVLYNDDYPYETGVNTEGVKHFKKLAQEVVSKFDLKCNDLVVDIGSNDGTLLEGFQNFGCQVLGIEPVESIWVKAGIPTLNRFFDENIAKELPKAKIITATNVVAHIDDLHKFVENIKTLLADDGIFVMEVPFLEDMINRVAFDQIYHEHLSYFGAEPLQRLFEMHDMKIINAEWQPIHGGTMRYYVGKELQPSYLMRIGEKITLDRLKIFADDVWEFIENFGDLMCELKEQSKSIVGVSAPAKGNTLLNSCYTGITDIEYITEKSPKKIGRYTPGTHIEIVPDSRLIEDQPDYAILFAHNWEKQIKNSLKDFKGEWIIPNVEGLKSYGSHRHKAVS